MCAGVLLNFLRLPDSASMFTAEIWVIIKAMEQIKDSVASKYIIFMDKARLPLKKQVNKTCIKVLIKKLLNMHTHTHIRFLRLRNINQKEIGVQDLFNICDMIILEDLSLIYQCH